MNLPAAKVGVSFVTACAVGYFLVSLLANRWNVIACIWALIADGASWAWYIEYRDRMRR